MTMADDELGAQVRRMLAEVDPVPQAALDAASAAFGWRNIDAELATLTSDTLLVEVTGVRGTPPRLLSFTAGEVSIDLEVTAEDETVRVLGQLMPQQPAEVTVEHAGGGLSTTADPMGRFAVAGLPVDWLRVVVTTPAGRSRTEWFKPQHG